MDSAAPTPSPRGLNFWDWLSRFGPGWPSARGWYALALFSQSSLILLLVALFPKLSTDEFFKSLATAIVVTGWVGFAVAGRDNRADLDRLGKAQDLASGLIDHLRSKEPADPFGAPPAAGDAGATQ